jgi:hypothetical protein
MISQVIRLDDLQNAPAFREANPLFLQGLPEGMGKFAFIAASSVEMLLLREGVIADQGNYKMELSYTSLKINGKRQSDDLHRRVKAAYEAETGRSMTPKARVVVDKNN